MGRGGEEEPVLELRCELHDTSGELRGDRVRAAGRRRSVVGLVEDQQGSGAHEIAAEPGPEIGSVLLILDEVVRDDETVVCVPRVDVVAALFAESGERMSDQ